MAHRLGFAVKVLGNGGLPSHDTRRWQSGPHLRVWLEAKARDLALLRLREQLLQRRFGGSAADFGARPRWPQGRSPRAAPSGRGRRA